MAENSKIEWTDHTFNPWVGCTKVSPGCDHCYAEGWAKRAGKAAGVEWGGERRRTSLANWLQPLRWNAQAASEGRRFRVFCSSLADVFDNQVPDAWRMDLFQLIADTPHLDWLLLTKRISNVEKYLQNDSLAFDLIARNVWLGATVVDQAEADRDIPKLLQVPARVRFLSIEPMLGPIDIRRYMWPVHASWPARFLTPEDAKAARETVTYKRQALVSKAWADRMLSWVICGGESGPNARPMHPDWASSLRDQCAAAGVPFLFKQWGEWVPMMGHTEGVNVRPEKFRHQDGTYMGWAGKKAAGRMLNGRTHDAFPSTQKD